MLYFKGCVVREKLPGVAQATEKILKKAGVDYTLLGNESCCGSFLMRTGFKDEAEEVMKNNLQDILAANEKTILVSCSGCYNTLKNDYKALFDVELDVIHTSELVKELLVKNKIHVNSTEKTVTYHDPCHLGRHSGIYEEPRDAIKASADLVEMKRNRERSRCCGAGSGVKSAFPELALEVGCRRIQDAEEVGADILVTTCSFCILNLENALEKTKNQGENGSVERVMDLTELILMGMEK
ncbi:CoB--CoM heterodisulfide reductase [Methanobacterium lacus]|uniref:CoB--CoM heterodisulfide reductase n=1 Tax=Methanobacterium lacus (strain AL-21) TaxID=877455 RepID=F0TC73_METLA|nr:(Fe-S)-binding protein [Methanobacterium lacus]ADZ09224.1 CoB--CoM heterodisulfide reductase [Methanobacterium lacus]